MSVVQQFERHPKTGAPVQPHHVYEVGDLVTERFLGDGTPGVVVAVTPKTLWVAGVDFVGNFEPGDLPGYNGYGDSGSIVVDPESVDRAMAVGKVGAHKYVLRVSAQPREGNSIAEREQYGEPFHRARWALPGSNAGSVRPGASYRQDPHV